ncbi:MAG: hypothetical protein AAGD11_18205 [Planctomycetota bacterium]
MLRASLKIVAVAALCATIVHLRDAQGDGTSPASRQVDWVRTVDGWEPISVLTIGPPPPGPPTLHPAVVATLQLGVSVFALLALPTVRHAGRKR